MQNDAPRLQCFESSHSPEQQSALVSQPLPAVRQRWLSGVHSLSAPHTPPQHSAALLQLWPSDVQLAAEHPPLTQLSEQHSVGAAQGAPELEQLLVVATHPAFGSHTPEQHSLPSEQVWSAARQSPCEAPAEPFGVPMEAPLCAAKPPFALVPPLSFAPPLSLAEEAEPPHPT